MTFAYPDPPKDLAGYDPFRTAGDCRWNQEAAERAVSFFGDVLTHPDDSHSTKAGDKFVLQKWQADYVATLYGWKRPNGSRRYRESLAGIPRKNGKSTLAAGLVLLELTAMGRQGAQIYSAAQSRDQAALVYNMAARMVRGSRHLAKKLDPINSTKRITYKAKGNFYRAIPADAGPVHGTKPAVVIFDELHTQRTRDLYDALKTGQGATPDPLFVSITTAGHDRHSICYDVWNTARQVRDRQIDADYFLPLLYELGDDEDWQDESTWHKCNPNLGVSIQLDPFLRDECQHAKESPGYENTFRNLYLNQWTQQDVRWLSMDKWDACGETKLPDLAGLDCFLGVDLSTTTDITAVVAVFTAQDGGVYVLPHFWIPEDTMRQKENLDRVPYSAWVRSGHVTTVPGNWIEYNPIREYINDLHQTYNVRKVAIDRWNASQFTQDLMGDGFDVEFFGQGFASMSAPAKEMERLVLAGQLYHANNPVLHWMAGNVAKEEDAAGNIKPSKKVSTQRIDGIVATVMAVAMHSQYGNTLGSWYDKHSLEIG
jgi:phage terminase large subunit-like protein